MICRDERKFDKHFYCGSKLCVTWNSSIKEIFKFTEQNLYDNCVIASKIYIFRIKNPKTQKPNFFTRSKTQKPNPKTQLGFWVGFLGRTNPANECTKTTKYRFFDRKLVNDHLEAHVLILRLQ